MEESLTDYNLAQNVALIFLSAVLPLIATEINYSFLTMKILVFSEGCEGHRTFPASLTLEYSEKKTLLPTLNLELAISVDNSERLETPSKQGKR